MTDEQKYWVEARQAIHSGNVMCYGVWHITDEGSRECVNRFSTTRSGGAQVALHLANTLRDDLNSDCK